MDSLDVRIWREMVHDKPKYPMQSDIRKSFRAIADKLGVDEDTVRNRFGRMQDSGFVLGWDLVPNANVLDVVFHQAWFDVGAGLPKGDVVTKLRKIPSAIQVQLHLGAGLSFVDVAEDRRAYEQTYEMTKTDWRIVVGLRGDPRGSYGSIAEATGLSVRTVQRRVQRMTEQAAILLIPRFDITKLEGILAALITFYDPADKEAVDGAILAEFDEIILGAELGDWVHSFIPMHPRNAAQLDAIGEFVRALPGVKDMRLTIMQDRIMLEDNINALWERKAAQLLGSSPG
jgi:DNA-binding Lrp family transcriptional regulator